MNLIELTIRLNTQAEKLANVTGDYGVWVTPFVSVPSLPANTAKLNAITAEMNALRALMNDLTIEVSTVHSQPI